MFLQPIQFDYQLFVDIMAGSTNVQEARVEVREVVNEDGDVQTVTTTYFPRRLPFANVDTFRLQETFVERICSQKY